ncbi:MULTISPECIES: DUF6518 family protein [unclassified Streptomyces]|uniref:DUF6518 family protein n=1 Tax=unclassified Streptomyces TaxID=2593676 RepID=UPI001F2968CC|nr:MULTISPECIES: DUF6518 family protein [unclassified Streptomyces]
MSASPVIPVTASVSDTSGRGWARATASAFVGGLLLGVLTNLAQGRLPGARNQIAGSGAVWSAMSMRGSVVRRESWTRPATRRTCPRSPVICRPVPGPSPRTATTTTFAAGDA